MWSIRLFPMIISYYLISQFLLVRYFSQGLQITTTFCNSCSPRATRHASFCSASRSPENSDAVHQAESPITSRRQVLVASSATAFAVLMRDPDITHALEKPPTKSELDRIKVGYEQIQYLLNNFEKETTVCRVSIVSIYAKDCQRIALFR
jgi:hypothetical protein